MIKTELIRNKDGTYGVRIKTGWFFWRTFRVKSSENFVFCTYDTFRGTAIEAIEHMLRIEDDY